LHDHNGIANVRLSIKDASAAPGTTKPYKWNGEPVEIETGIMFGKATMPTKTATSAQD
jgi:hypothetical protein